MQKTRLLNSFNPNALSFGHTTQPTPTTFKSEPEIYDIEQEKAKGLAEALSEKSTDDTPLIKSLPEKYSGLEEFNRALSKSIIKSPEAQAAVLSQMGLESGWGKGNEGSKYYNYGNITKGKSWTGDWFYGGDKDAKGRAITQQFRKYKSADDFLQDYLGVIERTYPDAYSELLSDEFDIDRFTTGLHNKQAGLKYAESPTYNADVKNVYKSVYNTLYPKEKFKYGGILRKKSFKNL